MTSPLRNLLLSAMLIAVPSGGFTFAEMRVSPTAQTAAAQARTANGLGDLSAYKEIVADTLRIAATGVLTAAERPVADFETLWDDSASAWRQADRAAWSAVDTAADDALSALRARTPDRAQVDTTLANLLASLDAPVAAKAKQPLQYVAGTAVSDESARALPCEDLIGQLRDALAGTTPAAAVADLQTRALERCDADDVARADAFAAQALSQINR